MTSSSIPTKKDPEGSSKAVRDEPIAVLEGGGEMGALMRAFDWPQTPIGPVSAWPQSLKTAARIILTSRYAMFVWWGRELINLYNDPYRAFLGIKHPNALGKSARDVWAEIWDQIGPRTDAVLLHGESTYDEALLLLMARYGYLEETYFTFSYSPLPDDMGKVGGLFCAVTEDTQRVIGERRLRLLREMASAMAEARTTAEVCQAAARSLASAQRDLPFSLIYLIEGNGGSLKRAGEAGIASGHAAAPDLVSFDGDAESVWPFRRVIETGEITLVENLSDSIAEIPTGDWTYFPECAALIPIAQQGQARIAGVLVVGLNPHRPFDDEFQGFLSLLASQIAASIASADAYETERRRANALVQLETDRNAARTAIAMSEERLRLAQAAAQIGTWEWDAAHDTQALSPELHRIFGTAEGDPHYAQMWESRVHRADRQRVRDQMEAGTQSGSMEFEYRYHHPVHGLRWFYCKGRRLHNESRMLGVLLDITSRKQPELRSAAQHKLSHALADSEDLLRAAPQILRAICEVLDWDMGALWIVHPNDGTLRCLEMWYGPESKAGGFADAGRSHSFSKGIGLPGRVWASAEPLWVPDVLSDSNFPRAEAAHMDGLHAAFGFPVLLRGRVLGVLEFFSEEIRQPDDALLQMMTSVGTQIGQYIERVQTQEALRDSEERYRTMAETASDAIVSIDDQSTILFANSATAEVFGYRPEELIGKNLTMLMPDYMRRMHDAGVKRYVETGQKHLNWDGTELAGLHKNGRVIPLEVSFGEYVKGGKHFFTGFARDVTNRKHIEKARQQLAAIVESSDDAIVGKDLNGIVTSWNSGAERMFGYKAEEMVGRSITAIIPLELHGEEGRILETIGRGERITHYETIRITGGGERIDVSLTISPVKDEAGRIVGAAKIARDITQRKKTEQTLRTTERLASVGRLAATVAHEINNPLEAVTNLIYLAKNNAVQEDVRDYLAGAEEELERVSQLTKQTLGFYRNTKGATSIRIGALVEPLLSVFSSRIRNKAIEIRPEIRQDPEIAAVPGEIRQLIANLLSNSIDAVEGGGFIRIRVSAATERNEGRPGIRLTVADSGAGIPPAVRTRLFEPFFTTKKDVGTGLGLWVCKSIVEKHGGSIRVRSSATPGRSWTAFSVFLPLNPPSSTEEELI